MSSSFIITDEWIQKIVSEARVTHINPRASQVIIPYVEDFARHLALISDKMRRRFHRNVLTGEDVNNALSLIGKEPSYGLPSKGESGGSINLEEFVKRKLPDTPLAPDLQMHWLAVNGVQPQIPENPIVKIHEADEILIPPSISKDAKDYFLRVTGMLSFPQDKNLELVNITKYPEIEGILRSLKNTTSLQPLTPYFTKFIHVQMKIQSNSLNNLFLLLKATESLLRNPHHSMHGHLGSIVPAVCQCLLASRLGVHASVENHWALRSVAAQVVALICLKYGPEVDDLCPRIYKTLTTALDDDKSFETLFGGIQGIWALGNSKVVALLIPSAHRIANRIAREYLSKPTDLYRYKVLERCKTALLMALNGAYIDVASLEFIVENVEKSSSLKRKRLSTMESIGNLDLGDSLIPAIHRSIGNNEINMLIL